MDSPSGGAHPGALNISMDLKLIQDRLSEIKDNMVSKIEIKDIVSSILEEIKKEMKEKIIAVMKSTILTEMRENTTKEIKADVTKEFEQKLENNTKEFKGHVREISDGFNLDFETLREKLGDQARELRGMKENLKLLQSRADSAIRLANQNQQYSQKSNIKFLRWEEKQGENLREDLYKILRESVNIDLAPADIVAILDRSERTLV
ncbi:uncharacterized protein LOC130048448 [Ostrea edulis]|uniref:uncharacterized protein LOC130048448 n=1 Tax=Ostrea edulis TaxID=37623 RepID=UPI0024AF33BC|nr:uncharacterized protein LOC130048448 [Ostrea edulis]